ncbi:hypothetical protein ACE1CD_31045 [Aerosakkonema sp. BLCC-F183]|uniref:hypothetical protein n=1 Tax=Aerosakkonema sp. BLCC-F183 TaxID=3342834 RepID=UPI0035B6F14A
MILASTKELQNYQWHNLPADKLAYILKTDLASEQSNWISEIVNSLQPNYDRPLPNRQLPC